MLFRSMENSTLSEDRRNNYIGIARLFRALNTYDLVRRYGDVIWIDQLVDIDSEDVLQGERQDRDAVMDKVLEDLDFAITNISAESNIFGFSKDMARAAKAEICLYEGTFCKYRTVADNGKGADMERSNKYLQECVKACEPLMSRYTLASSYDSIYKMIDPDAFGNVSEIITDRKSVV